MAPEDFIWAIWSFDPAGCTVGTIVTAVTLSMVRLTLRRPQTSSSAYILTTTAGATLIRTLASGSGGRPARS